MEMSEEKIVAVVVAVVVKHRRGKTVYFAIVADVMQYRAD